MDDEDEEGADGSWDEDEEERLERERWEAERAEVDRKYAERREQQMMRRAGRVREKGDGEDGYSNRDLGVGGGASPVKSMRIGGSEKTSDGYGSRVKSLGRAEVGRRGGAGEVDHLLSLKRPADARLSDDFNLLDDDHDGLVDKRKGAGGAVSSPARSGPRQGLQRAAGGRGIGGEALEMLQRTAELLSAHKLAIAEMVEVRVGVGLTSSASVDMSSGVHVLHVNGPWIGVMVLVK